jgi:hypothetical protein
MTLMPSTTYLMLRKPRSGCLEARTAPMQSHFSAVRQFPCAIGTGLFAGVDDVDGNRD